MSWAALGSFSKENSQVTIMQDVDLQLDEELGTSQPVTHKMYVLSYDHVLKYANSGLINNFGVLQVVCEYCGDGN